MEQGRPEDLFELLEQLGKGATARCTRLATDRAARSSP